jgi:hypothetical protein
MAFTTCVKCGGTSFEIQETRVARAAYRLYFVQCSSCGGAVAVQEFNNIGAFLLKQNDAINKIARALNVRVDLQT